jgi:hypothetical protein
MRHRGTKPRRFRSESAIDAMPMRWAKKQGGGNMSTPAAVSEVIARIHVGECEWR